MKINGIDAIHYFVHDFDRARSFYVGLIGEEPSMTILGSYCEWSLPNGEAFGLIKSPNYRQGNGILFNVDDVKASVDELRAKGVVFDNDGEIEDTPVCYMAFATDSEGNGFILHQRK
ncbi:MAG: VOC family protein [Candidatus Eremiobacteraeota bacterium]|nr:VOC family protein [Candidatus Eremiobacteraeota bacterium]